MDIGIQVPPLRWYERLFDVLMVPIMVLLMGTLKESPQKTHFWNNLKLKNGEAESLQPNLMVSCHGDSDAAKPWLGFIPLFHIPILGGWKQYVVVQPTLSLIDQQYEWHIGWRAAGHANGVSRIKLQGPVRVLIGPGESEFFALDREGRQIRLEKIGVGRLSEINKFSQVQLL